MQKEMKRILAKDPKSWTQKEVNFVREAEQLFK